MAMNWKEYYSSVSIDFDKVEKNCMSLTIKEIEKIARAQFTKGYDDSDDLPTLIPTMKDDPDFGTGPCDGNMVWNSQDKLWQKTTTSAGICDTMGCVFVPEKDYRFCKPCLKDRNFMDKWGRSGPHHRKHINAEWQDDAVDQGQSSHAVQSLAEGTILMMETTNDDWSAALDIIYKEDEDAEAQTER
jgi:hypothetical protein